VRHQLHNSAGVANRSFDLRYALVVARLTWQSSLARSRSHVALLMLILMQHTAALPTSPSS
jgi:hypothetical protein